MRRGLDWTAFAEGLRDMLLNHRGVFRAATWRDNYQPYLEKGLRFIEDVQASDGHSILQEAMQNRQ